MKLLKIFFALLLILNFSGCEKTDKPNPIIKTDPDQNTSVHVSTDKVRYNPGETVNFEVDKELIASTIIRYKHLSDVLEEVPYSGKNWQWQSPSEDYKGYMVEIVTDVDGEEKIYGSIAIDVSSDWTRFPRYGFLTNYSSDVSSENIKSRLSFLNRFHINGLQYYDWHNKHHSPLLMNGNEPASEWQEIARSWVSFSTVKEYILEAKKLNIASMSYNLLFGAWKDYASDGVSTDWMVFNDNNHQDINKHELDDSWALSDIYVLNPADENWQNYIFQKTELVYEFLDFDGWHLDQLGNRGTVYNYEGSQLNLKSGYNSFLTNLSTYFPDKKMVMNAVDQFGQSEILNTPVDFAYTEVWSSLSYNSLAQIIQDNDGMSNNSVKTVLAAYMNYDLANSTGYFNTPGVLLTDAVIFAFGGAHLELGEHMLAKEYFPNNNLSMKVDLKDALVLYYDFLVGYQNLLRDGGYYNSPLVSSNDWQIGINNWPPQLNSVSAIGKKMENCQVIHLINFLDANSLLWKDKNGTQSYPRQIENLVLNIEETQTVQKIWFASPDYKFGTSTELGFVQSGNTISVSIPKMQYWGMIVIEY